MSVLHIEERTLYPPLISYLQSIGFNAVGETKITKTKPDICFQTDSISFVVEIKIGKPEIGLKAVAQASDYARELDTQNIIILIYPEKYRNQTITDMEIVAKIALNEKVHALVLTEYWTESISLEPAKLFELLKQQTLGKKVKVDFKTIVNLIENYVRDLNQIVYKIKEEKLISEIVNKLDLFSSIGEIKDKKTAERQVMNLASYLLFNQLLFYHIYKKKTLTDSLPELEEINKIEDLQKYFDRITKIDYQSIYKVNILGHIPEKKIVIDILNEVVKAIKLLRAEHITHDLAGRFFHDLIPFEVRKVLAAFYTHPIAAEILAGLTISSYDETIIDPACGSGTLLVAAYMRKQELYQELYGYKDLRRMHKKFIENDLTGIDIMPFASHISAINLTMQNIEQQTNTVRLATFDSLEIANSLRTTQFKRKGIKISPYTTTLQLTLHEISGQLKKIKKRGSVSAAGRGSEFFIKPSDVVIMNPPFSDREKMPEDMRNKINQNLVLGEICGHHVNLWGYFLALSDLLIKPNGKIGAVIPINIARGKATEKIKNYLLENNHIKYIIKPTADIAFSESAAFRDILLIVEKKKPVKSDKTALILIKKSIKELTIEKIHNFVKIILESDNNFIDENLEIYWISYTDLIEHRDNLMHFLWCTSTKSIDTCKKFFDILPKNKLTKIKEEWTKEGFHASPAGLSELVFITNPMHKSRTERAFFVLDSKKNNILHFGIEQTDFRFEIDINKTLPALRTITAVKNIDITGLHDYIILNTFNGFDRVLNLGLTKWKKPEEFSWQLVRDKASGKETHLAFSRRFNLYSPNTSLFAFYCNYKFIPPDTLKVFPSFDKETAKFSCLFLNSTINILQMLSNKEETTGEYGTIRSTDLILFDIFDMDKLTDKDKKALVNLFDKLKKVKFPSILEQLENRFWARVELDKTILKILGLADKDINEWLPKIYDVLVDELKTVKQTI